jgi:GTP-binding protein HflX
LRAAIAEIATAEHLSGADVWVQSGMQNRVQNETAQVEGMQDEAVPDERAPDEHPGPDALHLDRHEDHEEFHEEHEDHREHRGVTEHGH